MDTSLSTAAGTGMSRATGRKPGTDTIPDTSTIPDTGTGTGMTMVIPET
jgi:hypothetical protein